jgi:conjugal transfer/entry exclusion protein
MYKRDIGLTPLVVGLGLLTRVGTGSAGLKVSISQFQELSEALKESLNDIALQISAIQDQINSLVAVVLQNSRGLDLLTVKKGRLCLFLG